MILIIGLLSLPAVLILSYIDYYVFRRWFRCINCGHHEDDWKTYIPANVIELFCFLAGILIGLGLR